MLPPPEQLSQHRILLVNDDGVHSRGIELLEELARLFTDDVWVVAPDDEKSGASHSISLSHPVRVRKLGDKRYAVKGTPTDCVIMAVWEIMADTPPTVVISGINHGENLAEDITYSGTAGPAIEAALLGIRS
ncbi:MAG: 5'/3'-nucleotidase SurE, partial [Proteobacteria bacterium]|nr:5'/3'-nucleotidase SurE [Pseudomonadota bacterium]